jgi:hypothetical protein
VQDIFHTVPESPGLKTVALSSIISDIVISFQQSRLSRKEFAMNRLVSLFILCSLLLATGLSAEKKFGKKITLKEKTKISDILANPEKYNGKRVLVEGPITEVCKKRGCWIRLGSDKEFETMTFKVQDGVIVFPMEVKGKTAVAEGVVSVVTTSVEDQIDQGKKRAKETGEEFDPASVKGPKTVIQIKGEGAIVK